MAVKDINGDGVEDVLVPSGILWMQGESDADKTEQIANTANAASTIDFFILNNFNGF